MIVTKLTNKVILYSDEKADYERIRNLVAVLNSQVNNVNELIWEHAVASADREKLLSDSELYELKLEIYNRASALRMLCLSMNINLEFSEIHKEGYTLLQYSEIEIERIR